MDPIEEIKRFWALGHVTAAEAAVIAVGGTASDDYRFYDQDLAEGRSGPHTTADLPELDRYRIALERWLEELGRDPRRSFPTRLFAEWLRAHPDCPGRQLAREAGIDLRPRRPKAAPADAPLDPPAAPPPVPSMSGGRLLTVKEWTQHHGWPTAAALRNYIFHAGTNGFDQVVRRPPGTRRVLIDEDAFFEWARGRPRRGPDPN